MRYILDADVFIAAKNRYYAFDVVPGFWECLEWFSQKGTIGSVDKVKVELARGKDELADWANKHFSAFMSTNTADIIKPYASIISWVDGNSQFKPSAKLAFAEGADGWLVAYAKAKSCVVVTNESFEPNTKRRVPIPNVCRQFNVRYINIFDLLKELGVQFGLKETQMMIG